jgi:2'-5' RNA ligase
MAFGQTWATFCARERTLGLSPGAIEDWRRGRTRYAVWALRIADAGVSARMAAVAQPLAGAIVPVAADDAHVTAWVCGFPAAAPTFDDDVAEAIIVAQRAAVARLAPPRLAIAAPNAFATCAFLEVHDPFGDLAALRAALMVPGAREVRFARYQPHVTVGRFKDTRPIAPLADALRALRTSGRFASQPIRTAALELIELDARQPDRMMTRR